jgi:hypothetical protein
MAGVPTGSLLGPAVSTVRPGVARGQGRAQGGDGARVCPAEWRTRWG